MMGPPSGGRDTAGELAALLLAGALHQVTNIMQNVSDDLKINLLTIDLGEKIHNL